jgi:sugar phosphate isomerase/epimerase
MRPVSLYTGGRFHAQDLARKTVDTILEAASICQKAGFKSLTCNPDPIGRSKTDAELSTQLQSLEELGRELAKLGISLAVHHHTPEMLNGGREFHFNFQNGSPLIGFCYDVHWVYRGGLLPQDVLPKYGRRIETWHVRQSREGTWWEELAEGDLNYRQVLQFAKRNSIPPIYTVELALESATKITRSVVENHRRSRDYLAGLLAA